MVWIFLKQSLSEHTCSLIFQLILMGRLYKHFAGPTLAAPGLAAGRDNTSVELCYTVSNVAMNIMSVPVM